MRRRRSKEGSALIIVLSVAVVLALLVAGFTADMNGELKAAAGNYEEALHTQLALSAVELARLELGRSDARLYANGHGDAYLVSGSEDYESAIEELQVYRDGMALGRGFLAYRLVYTPSALDPNELGQDDWHRLLEIACGLEDGTDRSELVDRIIDWIDTDSNARANGMEEEDYQQLDVPRHVRNGPLESEEELMLVYGITPELFYGTGNPAYVENSMIYGGGILRYLIGDNSPEGKASAQYILQGIYPAEDSPDEEEELEYEQVERLPERLFLIAEGYATTPFEEENKGLLFGDDENEPVVLSRRYLVVRLRAGQENDSGYELDDRMENVPGEQIERILAYGEAADEG